MGITTLCSECKQKMFEGVLAHTDECSANHFKSQTGTGIIPPAITIRFDTPEEQKRFMDGLSKGSSSGTNY